MTDVNIFVVLGYISTAVGIIQAIPSLHLMYKLGHCEETSLVTLALRWIGTTCSSAYIEVIVQDAGYGVALPMIISNVASWVTLLIVTYFKLYLFNGYRSIPTNKTNKVNPIASNLEF